MPYNLKGLEFLAEGISKLFLPFVEVVVHDLKANKLVFLSGHLTPRKIGDSSYLSKADRSLPPGVYGPYSQINSKGKPTKSISIVLPSDGNERLMICINFDVSDFQHLHSLIGNLTSLSNMESLEEIFDENWQDKIHKFVSESLAERGLTLDQLSREDKKEIVFLLRKKGAFNGKNAASYIAQILNVSRASIYGYLKEDE